MPNNLNIVGGNTSSTEPTAFNPTKYLKSLMLFVCGAKVSFDAITSPEFQRLVLCLNPSIGDDLIVSRSTLIAHFTNIYNFYRPELEAKIQNAKSLVHISPDVWTSPDQEKSFIAVHAQWVDENYAVRNMLIGLSECPWGYSGPYQASYIVEMIKQFSLSSKVGYFTGDIAGSSATYLEEISSENNKYYGVRKLFLYLSLSLSRAFCHDGY